MPDNDDDFPGELQPDGTYLVDLSKMDDVEFFQARSPGFRTEDGERVEPQHVKPDTSFELLDIVLFLEKESRTPVQEGVNQQAYVVDDKQAIYVRGRRVRSISLDELRKHPEAIFVRAIHPALAPYVADTFIAFKDNPLWFGFATNFLRCQNFVPFLTGEFFPPDPTYEIGEEYEAAWQAFIAKLEPHDYILTFDRTSMISKLIAKVTHGPFSHIAHYMGDGKLWEVVTSGTRIAPLEVYKGRKYRVAAYRHTPGPLSDPEDTKAMFRRTAGRPGYNYFGAIRAGVRTYFGDLHDTPATPNGIILAGPLTFIAQV